LPPGEVDRLQTGADLLHRLVAGQRAERVDVVLGLSSSQSRFAPRLGERVLDGDGAAQALDLGDAVGVA
jgi:hypothetical protein